MTGAQAAGLPTREADSAAASAVKAFQAEGRHADARERFAELVARHQRRAARIAFHYVRDSADADEAVQDAFVKAYSHSASFRDELPFEVWFTRILINGCLDRMKARRARERWLVPTSSRPTGVARNPPTFRRERRPRPRIRCSTGNAVSSWPPRGAVARSAAIVFTLSHYEGRSSREVSVDGPQ